MNTTYETYCEATRRLARAEVEIKEAQDAYREALNALNRDIVAPASGVPKDVREVGQLTDRPNAS